MDAVAKTRFVAPKRVLGATGDSLGLSGERFPTPLCWREGTARPVSRVSRRLDPVPNEYEREGEGRTVLAVTFAEVLVPLVLLAGAEGCGLWRDNVSPMRIARLRAIIEEVLGDAEYSPGRRNCMP